MDWNKFRADTAAMLFNSMQQAYFINPNQCSPEASAPITDAAEQAIAWADILTERLKAKED